jgi:hypothetical protein
MHACVHVVIVHIAVDLISLTQERPYNARSARPVLSRQFVQADDDDMKLSMRGD